MLNWATSSYKTSDVVQTQNKIPRSTPGDLEANKDGQRRG